MIQELLQGIKKFRRKFINGEATLRDEIDHLKSFPPEQRSRLAIHSQCEIFKPGAYEEYIALLEKVDCALRGPRTPANSQLAALFRLLRKEAKLDIPEMLVQGQAAMFNLTKHVEHGMPLRPESLGVCDRWIFAALRMHSTEKLLPPGLLVLLAARAEIARVTGDKAFNKRLKQAHRKGQDIRPEKILQDIQLPMLKHCLLLCWSEIPGWELRVGLCDFTYTAIGNFCSMLLDPKGQREDVPFDKEKVRNAVRSLKLQRNRAPSVTNLRFKNGKLVITKAGKESVVLKR